MSKTISVETAINAPLNKVWDEVSQIQNHSNWMKDAVKIDFESELRSGIGTKIKVLTKIGPFKLYDYMTFTKWEENKTIVLTMLVLSLVKERCNSGKLMNTLPISNGQKPLNFQYI